MDKTTVVHIRHSPYDVYIGRGGPFGNPFKLGVHGDREQVIELFERYFMRRLFSDPAFKARVKMLKGKVLGCYCKPLACHGDIIAHYLDTRNMK